MRDIEMAVDQVHAEYVLNIVTDRKLSQEVKMMFGNIRLLVIIDQELYLCAEWVSQTTLA